ncbi:MAG: hypothetical protein ABR985_13885 [Methanotrichaceae archaeon]
MKINLNKLIYEVKANSDDFSIDDADLENKILKLDMNDFDIWQICSGHDLTRIFAVGLNRIFGFDNCGTFFTDEVIEKILRISYTYSLFSMTQLYRAIMEWELMNNSTKILIES